uniref:Uncharacterized protein n=1 Tax=Lepeophtheirus salmonis TaxID=72036 RepID=A0A0K2SYK4_LEPSM
MDVVQRTVGDSGRILGIPKARQSLETFLGIGAQFQIKITFVFSHNFKSTQESWKKRLSDWLICNKNVVRLAQTIVDRFSLGYLWGNVSNLLVYLGDIVFNATSI